MKYVFAEDGVVAIKAAVKADPQTIGEALEKIRIARGGELQPSAVVEAARSRSSPLHRHFEWSDQKAAELHRLETARSIIRLVRIDGTGASEAPRAFLSVTSDRGVSYRSFDDVLESSDLREAVLKQAESDLDAFTRRYRSLQEVLGHVEEAKKAVQRQRARIGRSAKESRAGA